MTDDPVQITVREGQGWISGCPAEAMDQIKVATRYRPAGYQFSPKFNRFVTRGGERKRMWDGWIKLCANQKFPSGLLGRITNVLDVMKVPYELDIEIADGKPDLPPVQISEGVQNRDYQDEAVEAALLNNRGIIRAPTGSGKTLIGIRIVVARGKHALIVVPTIDLLHQYRRDLENYTDLEHVGQLGDGVVDPQNVTVATVRTAAKAMGIAYNSYEFGEYDDKDSTEVNPSDLREWLENIGTLIVDEAHILGAQVVFDLATKLKAPNKYGMSASPWRDDGADLMIEAATGPPIYRIGTRELVDEGYLVAPVISVVNTASWWRSAAWEKDQWAECYREEIVENDIRNQHIANIVNNLDMPTLVLVKQIKHGRILQQAIPDSVFLSGKDKGEDRSAVFEDLRSGRLRVIVATTIADMGLDLPICQALVLAGGGKSSTRHLQRIGRVARPFKGKKSALVIDFDDSHINDWFDNHEKARRKIELAEWGDVAIWC